MGFWGRLAAALNEPQTQFAEESQTPVQLPGEVGRLDKRLVGEACIQVWKALATPTGFEPAIFGLTGRYVKPLHHGAAGEDKRFGYD